MNKSNLHEYQKRTANFIAKHSKSIISVDMGLGKTASVLAWMDWFDAFSGYKRKGLIVAPKRVAENNWQQEAFKWEMTALASKMIVVKGSPKKRAEALADDAHPIKILSRDNLKDVKDSEFDFLVLDELTSFKNVEAARTKTILSIKAPIRIGLTGTFLANGAIDIYGQAAAVGLDFGRLSFYAWRGAYFRDALAGSGLAFHKWVMRSGLDDVLAPIKDNIFTLTAADYLKIPPVTETTHKVDVGSEIREAIDGLDAFLAMELDGELLTFDESKSSPSCRRSATVSYIVRTERRREASRARNWKKSPTSLLIAKTKAKRYCFSMLSETRKRGSPKCSKREASRLVRSETRTSWQSGTITKSIA